MPSLSQDIRGALQNKAGTVAGFPASAQRAREGITFTPTIGVPWARMTLVPTSGRAESVGAGMKLHLGLFLVEVILPNTTQGVGTGGVEALADAVKETFAPGIAMPQGAETVTVRWSERGGVLTESDWIRVIVTVAWQCWSTRN